MEIKEDLNKRRGIPCTWIRRYNVIKMSVLPKLIYKFNATQMKIPTGFFVDIDKLTLKFIWKGTGPRIARHLEKEENDIKAYCIAIVVIRLCGIAGGIDT